MTLFRSTEMKMYTIKDFEKPLSPGLIMIGVNWCSHCKELKPTWKQLYKEMPLHISAVDGEKNQELLHILGIRGYPTILVVNRQGKIKPYSGPRTIDALRKKIPNMRKKKTKN